jgi:superfamily II DNA or RNA helicase
LIVRLDQLSRNEELQDKLCAAGWDVVVFDEAHKLAAHYFGSKLEKTARFRFAEKLGATTRHLLLMTATPHNGKEEDFSSSCRCSIPTVFTASFETASTRSMPRT